MFKKNFDIIFVISRIIASFWRVFFKFNWHDHKLSKVYASYEGLTRHVDLIHRNIKRFECEYCGYKTNCNNRLRNHTKTLHTKEPFHCNYCDFISYSHKAHQKHTSKVHAPMKKKKIIVDHWNRNLWKIFKVS